MKIFTSYASEYRDLAERLSLAFEAEGHESFLDRTRLQAGQPYHGELREAIASCDLFVFLVAPESVAPGSYARSELSLAEQRWRHPARRVLPVLVAPTPFESIPPYLGAVTVLQPQGDVVAETVAALARMKRRPWRWLAAAAAAVLAVVAGVVLWQQHRAEQARIAQEVGAARELCAGGSFAAAWPRFDELAARYPDQRTALASRADCGMQWLREIRVQVGKQTFTDIVGLVQPAIVGELAAASGVRAADLRAHLGWADYLRGRDGAGDIDPPAHYRRALADDAGNAYAHAMWGHHLMMAGNEKEAVGHFDAAVAAKRDLPFVRTLQLSSSLARSGHAHYAVRVADEMRRNREVLGADLRRRLWSSAYYSLLFRGDAKARADFLALLPPAEHLATFDWLYPDGGALGGDADVWSFCRAMLVANSGQAETAREILKKLEARLTAGERSGFLLDETRRQLAALR